jgi:hypothetical protein
VLLAADGLEGGSYQYVLRALKCGKPGTSEARFSRSFSLLPGAEPETPIVPLPPLPLLPQALFALPTLLPTVPAAT